MNNKIMIIGEAHGEAEEKVGLPFVGLAGKCLDSILEEVGIQREGCTITNVMHERPPNNNFMVYYDKGKPTPKLQEAYIRLANEIQIAQPNVVVCLGNEAMKAVLGFGGIMDWRGSILQHPSRPGVKVIPTIHPSAVLREWSFRPAVIRDFHLIKKESEYAEIKESRARTTINPSLETVLSEIELARSAEWCAFDIETESGQITCIGLSYKLNEAICIPFWFGSSGSLWSEQDEQLIWLKLKQLLESDTPRKIAHNGSYETEYLYHTLGIKPKIHFDTMLGFHTLYPELPKALAYVVSIYTDHPFYKFQRRTDKMEELWRYNATDALLTFECAEHIQKELKEEGLDTFHQTFVEDLVEPLSAMTQCGVKFDKEQCNKLRKKYESDVVHLQDKLNDLVGHPLNVGSHKQMTTWLYTELNLSPQYKSRKGKETKTLAADEEALSKLHRDNPNEAIATILEMREKNKLLTTYLRIKLDEDKRIRCTYNIAGTETGRLSSSATAFGTGTNLQNIPDGDIRRLIVSDDRNVLVNVDLSQAEARVVAYLAEDRRLIEVFETGGDIHTKNAANIFGVKESEVTSEQRYIAKRGTHSINYGAGFKTVGESAGIPASEAKRVIARYLTSYPRIRLWQMQVQNRLRNSRVLTTPFGRKRTFFNRFNDSLLKEGLAYVPQSTVADIVNQAIIHLHQKWRDSQDKFLLLQVHDSIVCQCNKEVLEETIQEVKEALTIPLIINNRTMIIPSDVKVGTNWGDLGKVK